ncbi:DUF4123 domain-containing protein [Lysobacter soli]|uniref:DUF4123 domain-containing protein n=1 Tax=Lysobacter soli TaxID=453783 RepID=UPI0015F298E0|nr:DUF4123 domain-containing protein [Lysobacter soli]
MNPLPDEWARLRAAAPQAHELVFIDGAVQHELGGKLAEDASGALSLFVGLEPEAQALGPWLMSSDTARGVGIDGAARGVNWLLGRVDLTAAHAHLVPWIVAPLPDGAPRGYVRVADGRTLRALVSIWHAEQRTAFFQPWHAWCCGDRDGRAVLLNLPQMKNEDAVAWGDPALSPAQFGQLCEASVPDQLLHQAKGLVVPHVTLSSRERRHEAADTLVEYARSIGYDDLDDQFTLLQWVLKVGTEECRQLGVHTAIVQRLRGAALWAAFHGTDAT